MWSVLEHLEKPTLSALYRKKLLSPQDVAKLTRLQIESMGLDDQQMKLLYRAATALALELDEIRSVLIIQFKFLIFNLYLSYSAIAM